MPLDISGMRAAMFNTPQNHKQSSEYYQQNLQQKIDETYMFASDTFTIQEETIVGTMDWKDVICRVCHAIQPKTGLNLGDDFKDLKFFDTYSPRRVMGQRYQFDDSVWITTNTDNLHYVTDSAIVRRCNNTMNYIDSNGIIIKEPCIIDYSMKYANIYYNTAVEIPQGTIQVTVQANDNTNWMSINDRFIFNDEIYKIKAVKNYLRNETAVYSSNPLTVFDMFIDAKAADDDFEIRVTNMDKYKGIYPPTPPFVKNGIFISPNITEILQKETVEYECYMYVDDVKQTDTFTFTGSGASAKKYNLHSIDGNTFSVDCIFMDSNPLNITCSNGVESKVFQILLRGLF